ncbi:hypothetical protein D9758_011507 [Tetrapyrgos nigripes]|uniref:Pali-domain-containing protein n=1 Tax=Tetrapyrgos nigripes TaxID=182062 RepID=A0A8H5CRL9_9AGAR|nr:hypothetical protein D9758_011507 [Tetrapyrgos nigripes]
MVQLIGPATPGFLTTLVATILLGIVSFCVPYVKSVYFLEAAFSVGGQNGTITFGTLGYCLHLNNGTTCSDPKVGYELDINTLIGNETRIDIPDVVVKWITSALVLHIVALVLAGGSTVFGLLAHVCQIVGTCCSTCVSGFSATVALLAFIFDIVLFTIVKKRINDVGSATTGNAMWLTLAAFLLLLFTGCFYAFGSCCIPSGGGSSGRRKSRNDVEAGSYPNSSLQRKSEDLRHDQIRMQAVRAEADRQAALADREAEAAHLSHAARAATGYTPYQDPYQQNQYQHQQQHSQQPSNTSYLHTQYSNDSGFIGQHQPYSDDPTHGQGHGHEYGAASEYYNSSPNYTAAPPPGPAGYDGPPGYDGHGYAGGYKKIDS